MDRVFNRETGVELIILRMNKNNHYEFETRYICSVSQPRLAALSC